MMHIYLVFRKDPLLLDAWSFYLENRQRQRKKIVHFQSI